MYVCMHVACNLKSQAPRGPVRYLEEAGVAVGVAAGEDGDGLVVRACINTRVYVRVHIYNGYCVTSSVNTCVSAYVVVARQIEPSVPRTTALDPLSIHTYMQTHAKKHTHPPIHPHAHTSYSETRKIERRTKLVRPAADGPIVVLLHRRAVLEILLFYV